jgi:hypothetical protein
MDAKVEEGLKMRMMVVLPMFNSTICNEEFNAMLIKLI